jgi:hypothetical protein
MRSVWSDSAGAASWTASSLAIRLTFEAGKLRSEESVWNFVKRSPGSPSSPGSKWNSPSGFSSWSLRCSASESEPAPGPPAKLCSQEADVEHGLEDVAAFGGERAGQRGGAGVEGEHDESDPGC